MAYAIVVVGAGRAGTPDEVGTVLMGLDGLSLQASDFLMDGGGTAAYRYGDLAPEKQA